MIQSEARAAAWALEHIGQGYIWGATGWVCSRTRREQQARQYPEQAEMILGAGAKWDGVTCWDCATFVRGAAQAGGIRLCSGATSQWRKTAWADKGTIDTLPRDQVVMLYRQRGGKMQHVGLYLGDGTCAHAKGTRYGVVRQSVDAYKWTHWARPAWPDVTQAREAPSAPINKPALLRRGARGSDVVDLQQRLRSWGYDLEADGIFGDMTCQAVLSFQASHGLASDGLVGPLTWAALGIG